MTCPIIAAIEKKQMRTDIPDFRPGDTVRVHVNIKEGDKERIQVFEGAVIRCSAARAPASARPSPCARFPTALV